MFLPKHTESGIGFNPVPFFVNVFTNVCDLLIPRRCVVCGQRLLQNERHICLGCLADMPFTPFVPGRRNPMADSFNEWIQKSLVDDAPYEPYSTAVALFYYQGNYKHLTPALKYGGNIPLGRQLGRMLGEKLLAGGLPPVDAVIPVPLHRKRRRNRGFNQAEVIAAEVARCLGAPLRTDILRRAGGSGSQTKLGKQQRSTNVAHAFVVGKLTLPTTLPSSCAGLAHILIIDDVFTTGATLFACRQALLAAYKKAGDRKVPRISVATLAYAP